MLAGLGSTLIPGLEEPSKKRKETKKEGEKEKVNETYIDLLQTDPHSSLVFLGNVFPIFICPC